MVIGEARHEDLLPLLALYTHLHDNPMPGMDDTLSGLWQRIIEDPNHHIVIGREDGLAVSSCVLLIVPNLTRGQRPYALIENVVTHPEYRNRGYGAQILNFAKEIAIRNSCYKIMLMTGAKEASTLNFYRRAGYNTRDKTAFIQWLDERGQSRP